MIRACSPIRSRSGEGIAELPANWERAFGYSGERRWLVSWWEPGGDEAMMSDGQITQDGMWAVWLDLVDNHLVERVPMSTLCEDTVVMADPYLRGTDIPRWLLGSSDDPAAYGLLTDLTEREIHAGSLLMIQRRLEELLWAEMPEEELPQDLPDEADRMIEMSTLQQVVEEIQGQSRRFFESHTICPAGCAHGWTGNASDGYERCERCQKSEVPGWIRVPRGEGIEG